MKKNKQKKLIKATRKTARKGLKLSFLSELKEIALKMGKGSKKINKEIKKVSKKIATKFSKSLKIDKEASVVVVGHKIEVVNALETVDKSDLIASKSTKPEKKSPATKLADPKIKKESKPAVILEKDVAV